MRHTRSRLVYSADTLYTIDIMDQQCAMAVLQSGGNVFLTGEPGAGKTHTINKFIHWLKEKDKEIAVTASTGIAASHIGGRTIHSWSGIGIKESLGQDDIEQIVQRGKSARRISNAEVLIIDENINAERNDIRFAGRTVPHRATGYPPIRWYADRAGGRLFSNCHR